MIQINNILRTVHTRIYTSKSINRVQDNNKLHVKKSTLTVVLIGMFYDSTRCTSAKHKREVQVEKLMPFDLTKHVEVDAATRFSTKKSKAGRKFRPRLQLARMMECGPNLAKSSTTLSVARSLRQLSFLQMPNFFIAVRMGSARARPL